MKARDRIINVLQREGFSEQDARRAFEALDRIARETPEKVDRKTGCTKRHAEWTITDAYTGVFE